MVGPWGLRPIPNASRYILSRLGKETRPVVCLRLGRPGCARIHVVTETTLTPLPMPMARDESPFTPGTGPATDGGLREMSARDRLSPRLQDEPHPQPRGHDDERHRPDELGGAGFDPASDQRHDLGTHSPRAQQPDHNRRDQPAGLHRLVTSAKRVLPDASRRSEPRP